MQQFVLVLLVLAAPAATGRITSATGKSTKIRWSAGHQPREDRMFFSEDRTE